MLTKDNDGKGTENQRQWNHRHHLFDIAARLGTGLNEHDAQLFGSLLSFFNRDLPKKQTRIHTVKTEHYDCDNILDYTIKELMNYIVDRKLTEQLIFTLLFLDLS